MNSSTVQVRGLNYIVQPGDTLFTLADNFRVYYGDLLYFNRFLQQRNTLIVGQQLFIPIKTLPASSFLYVVKTEDSLSEISRFFNVPIQQLIVFNPDLNPEQIYTGQTMSIPIIQRLEKGEHPSQNESFTVTATAYGRGAGGGHTNRYGDALKPGMIAVKSFSDLFTKHFPFASTPHNQIDINKAMYHPKVRTFILPSDDGRSEVISTRGIKVRIDCALSPYNPMLKGNPSPTELANRLKDIKESSFEAVICDTSNYPDIDIYYDLPEKLLSSFGRDCARLTIIDQNDPIVHATLEDNMSTEDCEFYCKTV